MNCEVLARVCAREREREREREGRRDAGVEQIAVRLRVAESAFQKGK